MIEPSQCPACSGKGYNFDDRPYSACCCVAQVKTPCLTCSGGGVIWCESKVTGFLGINVCENAYWTGDVLEAERWWTG